MRCGLQVALAAAWELGLFSAWLRTGCSTGSSSWRRARLSRGREMVRRAGQLSLPVAVGLAVGTCAIAGLPPFAGFVAKGLLAQGAPAWAKASFCGLSLGGTVLVSGLLSPGAWGEAILVVGLGYVLYLGLRVIRPRLPRFALDGAVVVLLSGAVGIAGAVTVGLDPVEMVLRSRGRCP